MGVGGQRRGLPTPTEQVMPELVSGGPGRPSSILGPQERELRFLRLEHRRQTPPNETLPLQYVKHDFWSPSQLLLTKSNP